MHKEKKTHTRLYLCLYAYISILLYIVLRELYTHYIILEIRLYACTHIHTCAHPNADTYTHFIYILAKKRGVVFLLVILNSQVEKS